MKVLRVVLGSMAERVQYHGTLTWGDVRVLEESLVVYRLVHAPVMMTARKRGSTPRQGVSSKVNDRFICSLMLLAEYFGIGTGFFRVEHLATSWRVERRLKHGGK